MGTQGAGRKRSTNKDRTTAEDDALNLIAREAEARLAAKRAARAEAREIRMKELERQQKELSDEDERMSVGSRGSVRVEDGNYLEKGSRAASALTATTLTSLGGSSSRRGSGETALTLDAETSLREIKEIHELKDQIQDVESKYTQNLKEAKDKLVEVEEKYRKAMVSNAQLDNEKNNLMYQVDTLKDSLMELEEQLTESRREYEDKVKEFEREKHAHTVLQFQFNELKETLKQSEELLNKHGIVLGPDLNINGLVTEGVNIEESSADTTSPSAQETPISPTDGNNSMLGNNEEERNNQREETNPEKNQDMHDGNEKEHLEDDFNESNDSKVEICESEKQPISKIEQLDEMKTDQADTGISCEKNIIEAQQIEHNISDDQELRSTEVTENIASQETSHSCLEEQPGSIKEDSIHVINMDTSQSDSAAKEVALVKEEESIKPTVAASNIKDMETVDRDSEGVSSKSQGTSAGGKKKKRKKRGKKKEKEISEDKNGQNKEKVIAEQDSNSGLQVTDGNFTDHDCHNIQKDSQTELAKTSQETVDKSGQIVKETGPVSKTEKDSTTNCLDENVEVKDTVPFVEVNSTSFENSETAIDSTHIEVGVTDIAISKKSQSSDDDGQGVQSEAHVEMHDDNGTKVDQMDSSDKAENVVADNADEENQPSTDVTSISEVAQQKLDVESEQTLLTSITQISSSELNVQDNIIERSLVDDKATEHAEKSLICETEDLEIETTILNSDQGTNLQNEGISDEPFADDAVKVQVTDRTIIEVMRKVPDEETIIEEEKIPEITAIKDDKQLELSPSDCDGACSAVELINKCSNGGEEVEEALGSVCVDQISEVSFDITDQVELSNKPDDVPQESDQNGNEDLDFVETGTESGVICDAESAIEEPNDCNSEKIEVLDTILCGVKEVEVGVDVLLENDISKEQFSSGDSEMISQNIKNDPETSQSFVDSDVLVEENSLNQTNNSETHVLRVIENGHEPLDVVEAKIGSDDQVVCQDSEQSVSTMEVESKPLDEIGLEVLVEDSDTKDRLLETQVDGGTFQTDILDTESTNAVELIKDDPEVKATPADEKIEIRVEGQVEDDAKEESNSESMQSQNTQSSHKHLEDLSIEPQSPVESTDACHVESPRQKRDVEASQCITLGQVSEEEDEGEGLSFDFDDLEMEAAIALSSDFKAGEEEVELGVEVLAEEEKDDLVDEEQVESRTVDNDGKEQDETCNVTEFSAQNDDSDSLDSASLAEKSETSQEQIGASSDHTHIVPDAIQDNSENIQSSQKDRNGSSGESRPETNASSGQARSGKEAKKSSKKGKGKSKDECKMT